MNEIWNNIPWYGKVALGVGVVLLFVFTFQRGQLNELEKFTQPK